ncbi:gamma-glutamyl hydrolase 1-like isoform X2 [Salvia splendens]|uniref:gamma-glutamyl hydrolase 1-like isoform X2 n=1 Tax=Salvia splendens TaxID=180675 RepID=UPI001C25C859|nr:gamma-glutamyl hydrolase 1-like isoform X2 [Salvia splendens]
MSFHSHLHSILTFIPFSSPFYSLLIPFHHTKKPLNDFVFMPQKLSLVNGVIFTGGVANRPPYIDAVKKIYKEILRTNDDDGHHVPLLAICLGFQLLIAIVNEEHSMKIERFDAEKHPSTLQLENIDSSGTVFDGHRVIQ